MGKEEITISKKTIYKAGIGGVILIATFIIISVISNSMSTIKIDMSKLYDITFEGLDGSGTVSISINQEEWSTVFDSLNAEVNDVRIIEAVKNLEYNVSKKESLSNGEIIAFEVIFPEEYFDEYKIKGINLKQEIEVQGLIVPEEVDVFDGLKVEFEGRSPFITCNINKEECNEFTKENVRFATGQQYFREGETVVIEAKYSEQSLIEEKVKVLRDSTEYEATSKEHYVDDLKEIDTTNLEKAIYEKLQFEYSIADDLFCGVELGWTNHYKELKEETEKEKALLVLDNVDDFDEETPYNMYVAYYRTKIGVEHRSTGRERTFDTEIDVLLIAKNLYVDENGTLKFDDVITVEAKEVDGVSDFLNVFINENCYEYKEGEF